MGEVQAQSRSGADANAKKEYGQTPLWCAVDKKHKAIAKLLLESGADVNAKGEYSLTPL